MVALATHMQITEAEKQKLRTQVKRLCQENAWLRDELATTQQRLQASEQLVAQLEEEKKQLEFFNSLKKYDSESQVGFKTIHIKTSSHTSLGMFIILYFQNFFIFRMKIVVWKPLQDQKINLRLTL